MARAAVFRLWAGGAPASPSSAAPAATQSSAAQSPSSYSDTQAWTAFHEATTTGIPADQNNGQDTLTWLQSQEGADDPQLHNLIGNFVTAWSDPSDPSRIDQAQAGVTAYCGIHRSTS